VTMGARSRSVVPASVAGATVALFGATLLVALPRLSAPGDLVQGYLLIGLMWSGVLGLTGALVLRDSPGNRIGAVLSAVGLGFGLNNLSAALVLTLPHGSTGFAWSALVNGLWALIVPAMFLIPLLYPEGRPMSPRWRGAVTVELGCLVAAALTLPFAPEITQTNDPRTTAVNPLGVPALSPVLVVVGLGAVIASVALGAAAVVGQLLRARTVQGEERLRITFLVAMFAFLLLAMPIQVPWANFAVQALAATSLVVGVLRYHLFDVGRALSRSVVYALLVAGAMAAALVAAALLGSVSGVGVLPALAAAVTAIALAGVLSRLQARVDRLVFGPRQDATHVLGVLGDRLAAVRDPEDVLPQLVTTVREALKLPYVGVTLAGEPVPAAADGVRPRRTSAYALRYGGIDVGTLELGLRDDDSSLPARDARLVQALAAQAGSVAHSAQSARELRRSREQLVVAREEERRALRRDLHDGLGPTLAGMSLGLQSLERGATDEGQARLAADLLGQSRRGLEEVRRMARDLRPAALDELGLADALRQHAQTVRRMSGGELDVEVTVAGDLPDLPAAVEVAAYRISQEALSNTTRHADASRCVIDLSVNGCLVLSIADDGTGVAPTSTGTGLRSMHERADELGGSCTVTFRPGVGTEVLAQLPVGVAG
jgi:two-component system, NarL family, sensor kinase